MSRITVTVLWVLFLCAIISVPHAVAQEDAECFFCHADAHLVTEAADGTSISLYVDEEVYTKTVHGENGCTSCHMDIEELPHAEKLLPVGCGNCHDVEEEYLESLHGKALQGGDVDVARCTSCHGTHDIWSVEDPKSKVHPSQLPETCGKCHSDPVLIKRHMISVSNPSEKYLKSTHAQVILDGNGAAAVCNDCHGTHDMKSSQDPDSMVHRLNAPETCGKCHPVEYEEYQTTIHGKALAAGIKDAPTCTSCHNEHDIESADMETSSVYRTEIVKHTCSHCHNDEDMMSRYGVETERHISYMDSFHGTTSDSGSEVVATCVSCHGIHSILPKSDPASTIHPDNLPATCGACHETSGPNFAKGAVHVFPSDPQQKIMLLVRNIYILLIVVTIGGMIAHNGLFYFRYAIVKLKKDLAGSKTHLRFSIGHRLGHFVLALSFIVLVISGFALRYPDALWPKFFFIGEAGMAARGLVHRVAACFMVAIAAINALYVVSTRSGRKELRAWVFGLKDVRDIIGNLLYGLGIAKSQPKFARYTYIEKLEYWGMWWGTILMVVTGFAMWFVNETLMFLPKIALDVFALIHFWEAWLALLTIIVWHMYHIFVDHGSYPMNWSWLTGRITVKKLQEHHPLEFERITAEANKDDSESTEDVK
jgi:cytochrome b subunit of formate dehydrogenase